ncbi:MAG TPA: PTS lactose/cellobiose transporter subunit IIA [Treponema sp.]|nr:PTS lactose/cellobiose transporter subunit IIA [Treponema sp.]
MDFVETSMEIIADAGDGKSQAMEAIQAAKKGDFGRAEELLQNSHNSIVKAHKNHSGLLFHDADKNDVKVTMLMVHAADHLSGADIIESIAVELVQLYKEVKHA